VDVASQEPRRGDLMRHVDMTADLASVIEFMVNSFIRPTDIKVLQHGHVDRVQGRYRYLRLRLPPTKGHSDPITTMTQAVGIYERLRDRHLARGDACGDQDYVFLPEYGAKQRDYALKQFQRQFEILLAAAPPLSRLMSPPSNWRILKSGGSIEVRDVEILEGEAGARAVADGTAQQPDGGGNSRTDRGAGGHAVPVA
jgi:hypothetical protein